MKTAALLALLASLVLAATAHGATVIVEPSGSHLPYQRWVDEAKVPTPDLSITVIEGAPGQPGWACTTGYDYSDPMACAVPSERTIYVDPEGFDRWSFEHEIGHLFDAYVLNEAERERFSQLARIPLPWWYAPEAWHQSPAEYFAENYAACAVRGDRIPFSIIERPNETSIQPRQHFQICTLIERAYLRS